MSQWDDGDQLKARRFFVLNYGSVSTHLMQSMHFLNTDKKNRSLQSFLLLCSSFEFQWNLTTCISRVSWSIKNETGREMTEHNLSDQKQTFEFNSKSCVSNKGRFYDGPTMASFFSPNICLRDSNQYCWFHKSIA